ncbi:MAG: AAA family ATPase [Methanomassiliicoccales archaeon]|jgi:cell division control protein 6
MSTGYQERGARVLKDLSKLSFDYVPDRLIHREAQLSKLWMLFRPVLEQGVSHTAFLIGPVGTGKTATSKRFCLDFVKEGQEKERAIDFVIVNCRQRNSESSVLLRLVTHFDEHFPDRGFSSAEMLRSLRKHIDKRKVHLVVVLDEADVLLRKGASDLIYDLSRFDEERVGGRASLSLILVSQKYVLDMLDAASSSTFKRANAILFERYNAKELTDIVADRASLALFPNAIAGESLELIGDIASEFGDARFAIELLEKAAMLAEEERASEVTAEHVRAAKALTYSVVTESKIEELDKQRRIVLLSIARAIKDQAYVTTGEAEKVYRVAAEEAGEKPRAHTQFWAYIQDLANEGLISSRVVADTTGGGRTTYISLPDIPAKVLKERLEQLLGS